MQWPVGVEGFEPVVKDEIDKTKSPLTGRRIFRYPFVCASAGTYKIAPVNFSFYNTDSNNYTATATKDIQFSVSNEDKKKLFVAEHKTSIAERSEKAARVAGGIVVLLVLLILLYWIFIRKEAVTTIPVSQEPAKPTVEELLLPVQLLTSGEDKQFYTALHSVIWQFTGEQFNLFGSELNKRSLVVKMNTAGISSDTTERLFHVLEQCEAGMFTNVSLEQDKQSILSETKEVLEIIQPPES